MDRTRLSLFYLAGYLLPSGLALVLAPEAALKLLLAKGDYGDVMPRFVGILLFALGVIVCYMIYTRAKSMYPATLLARVVILMGLVGLYAQTRDPLFAVLIGVVGLGFILTLGAFLADRGARPSS
jgi:uncharacterized protein YjeT (DUF2065 family)